jgi:hypothetical protein
MDTENRIRKQIQERCPWNELKQESSARYYMASRTDETINKK